MNIWSNERDDGATTLGEIEFQADDTIRWKSESAAGANIFDRQTNAVFRDPAAWYHIVCVCDSNQTDATSAAIYVNGVVQTYSATTNPGSAQDLGWPSTGQPFEVGKFVSSAYYLDGYLSHFYFIDGQKLTPSYFGETNSTTGQWIPKAYTGTFGNAGLFLDFSVAPGTGDGAGTDSSGNDNDLTDSGLAAGDQVTDSPTDNFCTFNSIALGSVGGNDKFAALSNGNLVATASGSDYNWIYGTIKPASGKWYWEITLTTDNGANWVGVAEDLRVSGSDRDDAGFGMVNGFGYRDSNGNKINNSGTSSSYGDTYTAGDVIGVAMDLDNGKIWFSKNGTYQASGDPAGGTNAAFTTLSGSYAPAAQESSANAVLTANFGQSSFATAAPTGFSALSTANLPDPTIADPSAYFQPTIYTGDGESSLAVDQGGNSTFSPALVWIKNRDAADKHVLFDTVRGATESLSSDNTEVEETNADTLTAFDSDGFTVGADVLVNTNTEKYVGWQWLADESWSSGATGTRIASSGVRNTTMGFSVASWTHQTSANYNIAHGLSSRPGFFTTKCLTQDTNWGTWHQDLADVANRLILNTGAAETTAYWSDPTDNTDIASGEYPVTSTLFGFQHDTFNADRPIIAYFWTEIEGFSKLGYYTGNANTDGPFISCGFRPSYVIIQDIANASGWYIEDAARNTYNVTNRGINAASTGAEDEAQRMDFLSNGIKIRENDNSINRTGTTFIFAAFADTPFKTATAR